MNYDTIAYILIIITTTFKYYNNNYSWKKTDHDEYVCVYVMPVDANQCCVRPGDEVLMRKRGPLYKTIL